MRTHRLIHPQPGQPPAYVANGLLGFRFGPIPFLKPQLLVNGVYGISEEVGTQAIAPVPVVLGLDLQVDGVRLSEQPERVRFVAQEHNFANGELASNFEFRARAITVEVTSLVWCSRTRPCVAVQETRLRVSGACALSVEAQVDPRTVAGRVLNRIQPPRDFDGALLWESRGALTTTGLAYITQWLGPDARKARNDFGHEADLLLTRYAVDAVPGQEYVLRQWGCAVPGLMHSEPHWQATRLVRIAWEQGFEALREADARAWAELWRGRVQIHGATSRWQDVADAAFFYLHSSAHASAPCSVAPFGLSRHREYRGNVFWDFETFMLPPLLLTNPEAAFAALEYRFRRLAAARDNARLNGYQGAQFPWQSGLSGSEVTPFYCGGCGGITELHVNLDVALAFAQGLHISGDLEFARDRAWPVLRSVAEWIVSRVELTARGYEIRHVTGINEFIDGVHNNAFTNCSAIRVLQEASTLGRRLGLNVPEIWNRIAAHMVIPLDPASGRLKNHDEDAYHGGVRVPESLAAFFPLGWSNAAEVESVTMDYELGLSSTFMGLPMLGALMGLFAARQGRRELAAELFEQGIAAYAMEPFLQFGEVALQHKDSFSGGGATVFLTNPAGFLLSLYFGLTGLRIGPEAPDTWTRNKIELPAAWEGLEVERLFLRGQKWKLRATHGMARGELRQLEE